MRHTQDVSELLEEGDALFVIDGGARNGPSDLKVLGPIAITHCFEPNPAELEPLRKLASASPGRGKTRGTVIVHPVALGEATGTCTLHISRRAGATSCLRPNAALLNEFASDNWSEMKEVVQQVQVPCICLKEFLAQADLPYVDFCKLDTQGTELDILRGAGDKLQRISVLKIELNFLQLYEKQPQVSEIFHYLEVNGFDFVDLSTTAECRRFHEDPFLPPAAYRLVWGDAIFMQRLPVGHSRRLHQALVLAGLGYLDPALHVLKSLEHSEAAAQFVRGLGDPDELRARLRRFVERASGVALVRYPWKAGKQVKSARAKA